MATQKTHGVELTKAEQNHLKNLVSSGTESTRKLTRARILLKAHEGWTDQETVTALDVSRPTVERIRKRYALHGLEQALNQRKPQRHYQRKLDGKAEAHLIALACGPTPKGKSAWSLRLLAERFVTLEQVEVSKVSHETIRQVLKKTRSNRGRKSSG